MDTESLLRESRAVDLIQPLGFQTVVGKEQFKKQLRLVTHKTGLLHRRQTTVLNLRNSLTDSCKQDFQSLFQEVTTLEPSFQSFFEKSEVEKNSYEQLLFSGWAPLQVLNTIPFALLCLAIFKQYIVPAMALFTPFFMILMPYVILKYWYHLPLTTDQYTKILMGMFGFQNLELKNPRTILQGGLTLFSVGQSIYQPIQNALHLQTIHVEMMKKAEAVQRLVSITNTLLELLPKNSSIKNPLQDVDSSDTHRLFAFFWDHPYRLRLALQYIGDCEVVYRLAVCSSLQPVQLLEGTKPSLQISQGIDPFLPTCVPFHLRLKGSSHHAILTGPNRGGKSSVLRSSLLSVIMAQTFGFAFGKMWLRPFDWIASGLRLEDRPGSSSLFESEVEFAIQIIKRAKSKPDQMGFILFDELFHSTNPPDGARTADIFLQKLWETGNTASFISTHVFELAKKAPKKIQRLCVPALIKNNSLHFTYALQQGICEVSSVDEILKEKGLTNA